MIKRKLKLLFLVILLPVHFATAQIVSPFNKLPIVDTSETFSFVVSGHFHGESSNQSTFPASTILAGIDTLNSLNPSFLMSLGDMFMDVNETYINNYNRSLFGKLKMPIFNAVGNHDLSNGNYYEKVYGKTFFKFVSHKCLFVVLNTELNDGRIKDEQLDFFQEALLQGRKDSIKKIFIFSHRPVWSENDVVYEQLFKGNSRTEFGSNNYREDIKPLLTAFSKSKPIYWMSGSLANGPVSFFYHKEAESQITFMQTAIRDLPRDAVLLVNVTDEKVSFTGISLTGQDLQSVESYELNFWKKNISYDEPFNYRLIPLYTKNMIMHRYFWIGVIFILLSVIVIRISLKKSNKKK